MLLTVAIHVGMWGLLVRNMRWLHWPAHSRPTPRRDASISVIVPARNEEADVEACLRSLLAQDCESLTVIVVNDHSTDATPQIIDRVAADDSRLKVIHDPQLREGWLGKHNAMQSAFELVDSEYVLLTDADVEFQPHCLSTAIAELEAHELDLLSLYPKFEYHTFAEVILLPIYVGGLALLLSPEIEDPRFSHAMAVGAFILVRAQQLRDLGGLHPIRGEILDDVLIGRTFKQAGLRVSLRTAPDLMQLRFFKDARHAMFGFTKHIIGSVQGSAMAAVAVALLPLLIYAGLIAALVYGLLNERFDVAVLAAVTLIMHYASLLYTRSINRFSAFTALAFPCVGVPFAVSCLWGAYQLFARGKFRWRGRESHMTSTRSRP